MSEGKKLKAIVCGGTGAIGKQLLSQLILDDNFSSVTSFSRRNLPLEGEKVKQVLVDMEKLDDYKSEFEFHQVAFCCLGTTKKDAGSAENFRHIDFDYVLHFAKLAKDNGVSHMHYVSSAGANANSWFLYPKTKGQVEEALKELKFDRLSIYRPGLLDRLEETRGVEKLAKLIVSGIPVLSVAKAMINVAIDQLISPKSTSETFSNNEIKQLSKPNDSSL